MEYYYYIDKKRRGPITAPQLKLFASSGMIDKKTIIEAGGKRCYAEQIKGLIFEKKLTSADIYGMEEVKNTPLPMSTLSLQNNKTAETVKSDCQETKTKKVVNNTKPNYLYQFYIAILGIFMALAFALLYELITGETISGDLTERTEEKMLEKARKAVIESEATLRRINEKGRQYYNLDND